MKRQNITKAPLLCWDIYSQHYFSMLKDSKREQELIKIKSLAKKLNWKNDINALFENENFEAIVITDVQQSILWVNKGFTDMTGYSKNYALNKTPKFLQGEETSAKSIKKIRTQLDANKPFRAIITNYKKDKSPYKCEVKIFPLFSNNEITHFLALERKVG